jgi:4'-phosphopantetheinyl transferase EntD
MLPPPSFEVLWAAVFPGASCQMSLLPLAEDEPPLAPIGFLRPDELRQWQSFASDKRKREWLGGRLCAYGCARRLARLWQDEKPAMNDFQVRDWWLANAEDGRPCWQGNIPEALWKTHISISHGGGYALAVMARLPVGVDVQPCQAKVERVAAQFANRQEENILTRLAPAEDRPTRLTLLWSAKESVRKATDDLPPFLAMRLIHGKREKDGWRLTLTWQEGERETTVAATLHDGHAFAFCLLEE